MCAGSRWLETNVVTITVDDVAVARIEDPGAICIGDQVTFHAAANAPGAKYSWNFGSWASPASSSQVSPVVSFNQAGYFTVNLSVTYNGCTSYDKLLIAVSDNPVYCGTAAAAPVNDRMQAANSIRLSSLTSGDSQISVFPNPVSDWLTLRWEKPMEQVAQVEILTVEGRILFSENTTTKTTEFKADLSDFHTGLYLLRIRYEDKEQVVWKVVKN